MNFSILVSDEKMRLQRMVKENGRKKKNENGLPCLGAKVTKCSKRNQLANASENASKRST